MGFISEMCGSRQLSTNEHPLSTDPAVRQARRQQPPSSLSEPPLLHDSLSGADYSYGRRSHGGSPGVVRLSSISEPDYYLNNSMSEGTYQMPAVLQRRRSGQGFAAARQLPLMQRIVVANRAASEDSARLHDSYSEIDYDSPYKGRNCTKLLGALADCQRKHPHESRYVCAHLQRAGGWCLFRQACPDEVDALEACAGASSQRPASAGPPTIPRKCHQQVLAFEACLARHSVPPRGE
ncbi:hypothetical protein ABPG75_007378 [Micractinium tetrahymenae]